MSISFEFGLFGTYFSSKSELPVGHFFVLVTSPSHLLLHKGKSAFPPGGWWGGASSPLEYSAPWLSAKHLGSLATMAASAAIICYFYWSLVLICGFLILTLDFWSISSRCQDQGT